MNKREKLLHKIAAKYISNESIDVELTGASAEMDCLLELLNVSKKLKNVLDDDNKSLEEAYAVIEEKKEITQKFINLTGINWSL